MKKSKLKIPLPFNEVISDVLKVKPEPKGKMIKSKDAHPRKLRRKR